MTKVKAIVPGIQVGRRFLSVGDVFDLPNALTEEEQVCKFGRVMYVPVMEPVKPVQAGEEEDKGKDISEVGKPAKRGKRRS